MLAALATPPAEAQTDGWLSVGTGIMARATTRDGSGTDLAPIFIVRLGRGGEGWGIRYGFNWFTTDVDRSLGGLSQPFGRLRVRPVMLGYGYGTRYRRARFSFNLKGGYAFSSFAVQPTFADAYRATLNTSGVRVDASNTFVLKPDVVVWVDVSRKIGLNVGAGYMMARPHVTLTSAAAVDRRRVDADMFMIQVGAVYSIF